MSLWVKTIPVADLAEGQITSVTVEHRCIAVARFNGSVTAFEPICPHRGARLTEGFVEAGKVHCPLHNWCFDLATGRTPNHPEKKLNLYSVRVENGVVEVLLGNRDGNDDPAEGVAPESR